MIKYTYTQKIHLNPNIKILINKREREGINHFKDPKAFIDYSNDMHDVYKNINDYNPDK